MSKKPETEGASILSLLRKLTAVALSDHEMYEIIKLQKLINQGVELKKDIDDGLLLRQGSIKGSQNGFICHVCADRDAQYCCKMCGHYFCYECFDCENQTCEFCPTEEWNDDAK
jgi:hypothetical protein